MTKEQIQNSEEHIYSSIDNMFKDIQMSLSDEMDKISGHIHECVKEINNREREGKSITILQKNVLLNLLQQRTNIVNRWEDIKVQKQIVKNYSNDEKENIQW